ncbi:Na+-translocating ferredoxin:NAD+ oxidoreductase RnfC subunit [Actinopolyspora biskrensis]|uniref:Na+-translocating ferredoxin:NAD+ oxidoreductase RnfC subunit n=1 Tax=Actinopolyspora biskrensis TaxID=1470178 RepID=A0A852Z3L4_9ACTN|nr:Lsr2 family protein [Actinopolyspora biskrensis]NYH79885.1 Na+-translocating ferredoxin:NAD+ oxidoreductase RnfC subunit [Actinopolyspora biskrensis]
MAERIQVELVDDIDGSEAQQTVTFAMDGVSYEIDLSEQNARKLRELFGPYIKQARTAQQQNKRQTTRKQEREGRQARKANRKLTEEIRGAARRTKEQYQQDRPEPDPVSEQVNTEEQEQDSLLEQPLSFSPGEEPEPSQPAQEESEEDPKVPAVSLPQFSSASD